MNAPKIVSIQVLENQTLSVKFANGIQKVYDCKQLLHLKIFSLLKHDDFFKTVHVDIGGFGISWNDSIDLSEYELWTNGKVMDSPSFE